MGLNEAQEAEIVEARLTALGDDADRYDILHAIAGFSDNAINIALRRLGGGGSGGGAVQTTTVAADHADILALSDGTPIQLVAAPVAGKFILPVVVALIVDTTAGPYTVTGSSGLLQIGLDDGFSAYTLGQFLSEQEAGQLSNVFASGSKTVTLMGVGAIVPVSGSPATLLGLAQAQDPTAYDGQPLVLAMDVGGGGGPLTDGNAANTLTATTLYTEIDL